MFDDLIQQFQALTITADHHVRDAHGAFGRLIPSLEETALNTLLENLEEAMDETGEYSAGQATELREHLLENIGAHQGNRPVHIRIYNDGEVFFFDEEYAGTEADFEAADYGSEKPQKYAFWKYGIYKPAIEGFNSPIEHLDRYPSYEEIIAERLSIWGHKAPYWYFIENGNQGGGLPYPSFSGTFVFDRFGIELQEAVRQFFDSFIEEYTDEVITAIDTALNTTAAQNPQPDGIRWIRIITKTGRAIWRPRRGNRFISGVIREE